MFRKDFFSFVLMNSLILNYGYSQTYIEPIVGLNFSRVKGYATDEHAYNDIYSDKGYNRNVLYGIELTQEFTNKLSLKVRGNYFKRRVGYSDTGIAGFTDVHFDTYNFTATPYLRLIGNLRIGLGISFARLRDFEIGKEYLGFYDPLGRRYDQNQTGWMTSLHYHLKPIDIELSYSYLKSKRKTEDQFVNSVNNLVLQISYPIRIINKIYFTKKKTICPTF